jgi:hypothetical protein
MLTPEEDNFVDVELNIFRYQRDTEYRDSDAIKFMKWVLTLVVVGGLAGLGYIMWISSKNGTIKL